MRACVFAILICTVVLCFPMLSVASSPDAAPCAALLPAGLIAAEDTDPCDGMTFRIQSTGTLKLAKRLADGALFTRDGKYPTSSSLDPVFAAGASLCGNVPAKGRHEFALSLFKKMEGLGSLTIEDIKEITIDGLRGYEMQGSAKDARSNDVLLIYQVILFEEHYYYHLCGLTGSDRIEFLKVFREMAQSFKQEKAAGEPSGKKSLPVARSRFLASLIYPGSQDITDEGIALINYYGADGKTARAAGYTLPIAWNRIWRLKTADSPVKVLAFYREHLPDALLDYEVKLKDISVDTYIHEHEGSYIIRFTPPDARAISPQAQKNGRCIYPEENFTVFLEKAEDGGVIITVDEWVLIE